MDGGGDNGTAHVEGKAVPLAVGEGGTAESLGRDDPKEQAIRGNGEAPVQTAAGAETI